MAGDELDVAADDFFEQFQHAVLRILAQHHCYSVMEVLCQFQG